MKAFERRLGLTSVIALSISTMLGSGIFVLPGLALVKTGPSIVLAYIVAGLCVLPATLSKAELATAMPVSGGTYIYVDRAMGPWVSTVIGLGLWAALLLKSSFALLGFGAYLSLLTDTSIIGVAVCLLASIVVVNVIGIQKVAKVQIAIVCVSLLGLLVCVAMGLGSVNEAAFSPWLSHGMGGFVATVAFVSIAYAGVSNVAAVAGEVKNPERTLPIGMLLSLGLVTLLYGMVVWVMVGNIPMSLMHGSLKPVVLLAEHVGSRDWIVAAALVAIITMASMANAGFLAASRFPFAMSREHILPAWLGILHPKFLTPVMSIALSGVVMLFVVLWLPVVHMVKLASGFILLTFVLENAVAVVLRISKASWYRPTYMAPFFPWLQLLGIVVGLGLLMALGWIMWVGALAMILTGVAVFFFYGRHKVENRSMIQSIIQRLQKGWSSRNTFCEVTESVETRHFQVLVGLFEGQEEVDILVHTAAAVAGPQHVGIVHLTEVPGQTPLHNVIDIDDCSLAVHQRRVTALKQSLNRPLGFEALATRDENSALHDYIRMHPECRFVVVHAPAFHIYNPMAWFMDHALCPLLLVHDRHMAIYRQILLVLSNAAIDTLLLEVASLLAAHWGGQIDVIKVVSPTSTEEEVHKHQDDVRIQCLTHRSVANIEVVRCVSPRQVLHEKAKDYDVLLLQSPKVHVWQPWHRKTPMQKLISEVPCSVVMLHPPST